MMLVYEIGMINTRNVDLRWHNFRTFFKNFVYMYSYSRSRDKSIHVCNMKQTSGFEGLYFCI